MSAENAAERRPLVVAVVLTWNDVEMAAGCVESILRSDYQPLRVVLVDNGSVEPCGQRVKERFPEIELLELRENQGFTGGCNRGIERALELGAEYVHLFNNDTVIHPHAASLLVEALEENPELAVASPLLLHPGEKKVVQFYRASLDRGSARHIHYDVNTPWSSRPWPDAESPFVPACAVLFRREALEQVGLFDETLCTSWEDYDLWVRLADAGWMIKTISAAECVHIGSETTGRKSPYITYYHARNRLICLFRHTPPATIVRNAPHIARTFWWQIRSYGLGNWTCHRAFARGVLHFLLGVRGPAGFTEAARR